MQQLTYFAHSLLEAQSPVSEWHAIVKDSHPPPLSPPSPPPARPAPSRSSTRHLARRHPLCTRFCLRLTRKGEEDDECRKAPLEDHQRQPRYGREERRHDDELCAVLVGKRTDDGTGCECRCGSGNYGHEFRATSYQMVSTYGR